MPDKSDFVIVGSGGGGGTLAWLLAKSGYKVTVLEQGPNLAAERNQTLDWDPRLHDERRFRIERPDPKRRLRGDYNVFFDITTGQTAKALPFDAGWTGSILGGGSVLWGTWAFRALPIDFKLRTFYEDLGQLNALAQEGYAIADWPIAYSEMLPFFNVAETLLGVSGDRAAVNDSIQSSAWYQEFNGKAYWGSAAEWFPDFDYPMGPYPTTPVGRVFWDGFLGATLAGAKMKPFPTPMAIVQPGSNGFKTKAALAKAIGDGDGPADALWKSDKLWSDRVRQACNMCGFCGEYLCWGKTGPKWGTQDTTLKEIATDANVSIRVNAKAIEILYDAASKRATGVRYLDLSDRDNPRAQQADGQFIVVSCGAVQSARLLLLSDPDMLPNTRDNVGRNAMFHLFGLGASASLKPDSGTFDGLLHGEFGPTGNVSTFATYFVPGKPGQPPWIKGGHLTSAAKKNPLEDAVGSLGGGLDKLLDGIGAHNRRFEVRLTADDLPMSENRVTLDPQFVDEYGIPVARIARKFGENEKRLFAASQSVLTSVFDAHLGAFVAPIPSASARLDLIGDHQMGTCRMGEDPATSVVNPLCRLHDVKNVFVVDSSFMPTGLGLNPMVTVVANALRVGTHIVDALKKNIQPGQA